MASSSSAAAEPQPPPGQSFTVKISHDPGYASELERFKLRRRDPHDVFCAALAVTAALYLFIVCVGPFCTPPCDLQPPAGKKWRNPMYDGDPCLDLRQRVLGGLTLREASTARHIYLSVLLGSLVGYERRSPDRPAGIRTMAMTSIGCCCFTISSMYAFQSGPMKWDSSRITADIVKGIGFFAGAVIWKGMVMSPTLGREIQQANGLTTATSAWLAAGVGISCGGGQAVLAYILVACIVLMLRFGPRNSNLVCEVEEMEEQEQEHWSGPVDGASKSRTSVSHALSSIGYMSPQDEFVHQEYPPSVPVISTDD